MDGPQAGDPRSGDPPSGDSHPGAMATPPEPRLDVHETDPEQFERQVLEALVEGFRARAGAKERFQALSEYELARRVGIIHYSYVEYDGSPEREHLRSAVSRLQRQGLVRAASVAGRYETFLPTEAAQPPPIPEEAPTLAAPATHDALPPEHHRHLGAAPDAAATSPTPDQPLPTTFEGRLDEMIRLLRSIDARLQHIERG